MLPALDDHVRGSSYMRFTGGKPLTNSLLPWEAVKLLKIAGFNVLKQETSSLSSEPSEVRKWLDKNPRIDMCMNPVQVYCGKPTPRDMEAKSLSPTTRLFWESSGSLVDFRNRPKVTMAKLASFVADFEKEFL